MLQRQRQELLKSDFILQTRNYSYGPNKTKVYLSSYSVLEDTKRNIK